MKLPSHTFWQAIKPNRFMFVETLHSSTCFRCCLKALVISLDIRQMKFFIKPMWRFMHVPCKCAYCWARQKLLCTARGSSRGAVFITRHKISRMIIVGVPYFGFPKCSFIFLMNNYSTISRETACILRFAKSY